MPVREEVATLLVAYVSNETRLILQMYEDG